MMVTQVLITTDTELSASLHVAGLSARKNLDLAIEGRCGAESYGISYQMTRMEENGLKGVFFVDPMPALVYGRQIIADIVGPIVERGHEVQLHIHTEWLEHANEDPTGGSRGRNIGDFNYADQLVLLEIARDLLIDAGAPRPTAFRAGNYGANDDTLRALAELGLDYDSSFNPAYATHGCDISLPSESQQITAKNGINVVPVSVIEQSGGDLRPAQLCALSAAELGQALDHAESQSAGFFNIVTHSFELIVRESATPNPVMIDRFNQMCQKIAGHDGLHTAGFLDLSGTERAAPPLPAARLRQLRRLTEQAYSRIFYEGIAGLPPVSTLARRKKPIRT